MIRHTIQGIGETLFVSRHRWATAGGWLLVAALCLGYTFLVALFSAFFAVMRGLLEPGAWWLTLGLGTILPGVCLFAVCVFVARVWVRAGWDETRRFRHTTIFVLVVLFLMLFTHFRRDAAVLTHDYSLEDIPSANAKAAASHDLLLTFREGGAIWQNPDIPCLGDMRCTNRVTYAAKIEEAWTNMAGPRKLLQELDAFEKIADLTEPQFDAPRISFVSYRNVAQMVWAFCLLRAEQGQCEAAARQLVQLQSVVRKMLPYSRGPVRKMICLAIVGGNLDVAEQLLQHPNSSAEIAELLRPAFSPLTKDETSMAGPLVFEYLCLRRACEQLDLATLLRIQGDDVLYGRRDQAPQQTGMSAAVLALLYNRNQTIREGRRAMDLAVVGVTAEPPDLARTEAFLLAAARPRSKNAGGRAVISMAIPNWSKAVGTAEQTREHSYKLFLALGN